ncbi:AAA-associated domain-containing protein [Candidatus Bathyarchaeota archaeon]|nr:AAA-associated domain-containing protein [Candidatus Bathyarchaeota archaeon]
MLTLPRVHVGQMIGLLEVLEDFKGRVDVAKVADDLILELDDLLPAVEAAELLGFLKVESGDLILTEEGRQFLAKGASSRKKFLNEHVMKLSGFKAIVDFLKSHKNHEVTREELLEFLRKEMSDEDAESAIPWIVEWGRYSLILHYDSNNGRLKVLRTPK